MIDFSAGRKLTQVEKQYNANCCRRSIYQTRSGARIKALLDTVDCPHENAGEIPILLAYACILLEDISDR